MKTLILILTLATFNMSFAISENMAECGLGSNFSEMTKGENPIVEVSADPSSDASAITIEQ